MAKITEDQLRTLVADICRVDESVIRPETRFVADLNMDSLTSLDLLTDLEEEWDVEVTQEDARGLQSFGQLCAFIAKLER
jgi:acyl carrier protein